MSRYTDAVERGLESMEAVSFGLICSGDCPACNDAGFAEPYTEDGTPYGEYVGDEGSFSWAPCGICDSSLGGGRYVWHWLDVNGELMHEDDGCVDCLFYISNGDEPEVCLEEE
jgi:hypothetical protein